MNRDCYLKAIRLLTQRDYSRPKLRKKLRESKFEDSDVRAVVDKVHEEGYLKEDWYIEARIKGFMRKGYSMSHIQDRLKQEELIVSIELIRSIFEDNLFLEDTSLSDLIEKKAARFQASWPELSYEERQKVTQKIVRAAVAKGYSPNRCFSAVHRFFSDI